MSRVCRLPLHTASRASIGKALSSLQFYHATKGGYSSPGSPLSRRASRAGRSSSSQTAGGFIFEPELGVHEGVGELDFTACTPASC